MASDTNTQQESNWVIGVVLNLIGSFSINFGTNLIQYSHFLTAKYKRCQIVSIKPHLFFSIAWFIFVCGNLLNFISFSYATQTVLSSLGSVQFIANIIFIYMLFKILPTKMQIGGTISIIIGNIFIVLVANKATYEVNSKHLLELFERAQYIAYLISILCLSVLFQGLFYYLSKHNSRNGDDKANYLMQDTAIELPESITDIQPPTINRSIHSRSVTLDRLSKSNLMFHKLQYFLLYNSQLLTPTCYALVSTMIGSQSVILAKSSSLLIIESIGKDSQFKDPITYVFIAGWFVAMAFWLWRMNNGLRKYAGVFIIPVLQVLWMLFSIISGGILFKEFDGYSWRNYIGFIAGTMFIFYGVYKLSPQSNNDKPNNIKNVEMKNLSSTTPNNDTTTDSYNSKEQTPLQNKVEVVNMDTVKKNMEDLDDSPLIQNEAAVSTESNNTLITTPINGHKVNDSSDTLPPMNSISSRTIANISTIFTTSSKILMKVTGVDGRTHLSGPCLSSTIDKFLEYHPYRSQLSLTSTEDDSKAQTQSLPARMPSQLSNAFRKIKLDNLKEENNKENKNKNSKSIIAMSSPEICSRTTTINSSHLHEIRESTV